MDFSNSLKFGIIFSILLLPSANAEPTVLNKQIREVYSKSVCAAAEAGSEGDEGGEEEDQETSKAQKKFDSEYQKKLENLIKLTLAKKDPNSKIRAENLEATMRFFAPVIVGSRFYTPIADNALTAKFSTTTDLEKRIAQDKNSYESNPNALKEDKSSFLEGTFYSTDDSKTSLNSEQKAQMDKLRIDLLEAVLANGSCTKFDLNAVRFTQKFFSSEDKAKEFASDPSHLESFERCEGPLERKGKGNSPPRRPSKIPSSSWIAPTSRVFFKTISGNSILMH
ncbi:MAG: hypothetical protein EBX52_02770 [Proteobacteria bacterium]|nr:hypothetical protein [Pseudomonadota bacterium]